MDAQAALREFEHKLVARRSTASRAAAFEAYERETLPAGMDGKALALVDQGYAAGFDEAMRQVASVLTDVRSVVIGAERD